MKKFIAALLSLVMVIGLCSCGGGNSSDTEYTADNPLVFRVSHVEATDSYLHKSCEKFKEYVEDKSEGKIKVEIYPNGELGDYETAIEAVKAGTQQMTCATTSALASYDPKLGLMDLPYLFESKEQMEAAVNGGAVEELYTQWLEENGFYNGGIQYDGARGLSNNKKEVKTPSDLKGLKIRVMQSDLYIKLFDAFGANPTPMSFTDLYTGLQQGTVDGQDNSPMLTYVNKFYEVQKYYSTIDTVYAQCVMVCSKDFMDSLPEDIKAILDEGSAECLVKYQRENALAQEEEYLKDLEDAGLKVTRIEDKTEWKEAAQPVYEWMKEEVGEDYVQQMIDAANSAE